METIKIEISAEEAEQLKAEIHHYSAEIERSIERMKRDHLEIERSLSRTSATLAELARLSKERKARHGIL